MKSGIKFRLIITAITVAILISGCGNRDKGSDKETETIGSLPPTAKILFVSNRDTGSRRAEIYAMDIDGGNVTRLTFSDYHHFIMGMDQSKRYIVTSRAENDTDAPAGLGDEDRRSLWVIDLETKQTTRLTDPANKAEGDSFSPDGEWIVFMMAVSGEDQPDIYKIRRDGSEITRLTNTLTAVEGDPAWSNDGAEIAFIYLDAVTPRSVLKKMDTDGGNIQEIYDGGPGVTTPFAPGNFDPCWSPDNQWIVFERAVQYTEADPENFGSGIWHIFKVQRDGTGVVDLSLAGSHADRAEYLPSFSPDGLSVILGSIYEAPIIENSHNDIFTMDINGGSLTQLSNNPASDMYPVWIP